MYGTAVFAVPLFGTVMHFPALGIKWLYANIREAAIDVAKRAQTYIEKRYVKRLSAEIAKDVAEQFDKRGDRRHSFYDGQWQQVV